MSASESTAVCEHHHARAVSYLEAALQACVAGYHMSHPHVADCLEALGGVHELQGKIDASFGLYEKAAQIRRTLQARSPTRGLLLWQPVTVHLCRGACNHVAHAHAHAHVQVMCMHIMCTCTCTCTCRPCDRMWQARDTKKELFSKELDANDRKRESLAKLRAGGPAG